MKIIIRPAKYSSIIIKSDAIKNETERNYNPDHYPMSF